MKSRILLGLFLSVLSYTIFAQSSPNIVFIIADDVSWNDFGCYGNSVVKTPNINTLAEEGMIFTNTFLTASSCSPSRVSIITGRYPHNTGACELHSRIPENQLVFPKILKEAGYYTAQAGKWHLGGSPMKPGGVALDAFCDASGAEGGGNSGAEKWVEYLQQRPKDKPFFMWFAAHDAHRDWGADNFMTSHNPDDIIVPPYLVDDSATRKDLASYYNEIQRLDYYVGEVRKELEKQGVLENTIIIVCADNGRPFPRCKTRVYDSGMKTPFVVHWPKGINHPGSICNSLISIIDLAPTLLELTGCEIASNFQGRSFSKLFTNNKLSFRQYVFSEHNWHDYEAHERMLRTKDFLYVLNSRPNLELGGPADSKRSPSQASLNNSRENGKLTFAQTDNFILPRPEEELFDLHNEPIQLNNVASDIKYEKTLHKLREVMKSWRNETKDNTPKSLTPNQFDPKTGAKIRKIERGEMPGVKSGGTEVLNSGPGF